MELYFNELSLKGKESIGVDCVSELIKVYRRLRKYDPKLPGKIITTPPNLVGRT